MFAHNDFADALERYRGLMGLWTLATVLALASQLLITTQFVLGTVFFLLAAATVTAAGVACAYVLARDSV